MAKKPKSDRSLDQSSPQQVLTTPQPKAKPDVSHFDKLPNDALIAIKALAAVLGQGVSTAWRNCRNNPDYPKPIHLSPGCTRFNVGDIRAYVAKQTSISAKPKRAVRLKGGAK